MIRNYINVAFRSLVKQKVFTVVNILGFSTSITACLLITLYVLYETSYDKFFPKEAHIYKMAGERTYPEHIINYGAIPHSFAYVIKKDFPEVENTLLVNGPIDRLMVQYKVSETEIKSFEENSVMMADSAFFDFFELEFTRGSKKTALSKPNTIVITEATAKRYFGDYDPMGKVLGTDAGEFIITGVCKNLPQNSHLRFDFVASLATFQGFKRENYTSFSAHVYIMLRPGSDVTALEAKFPQMVDTYAAPQIERNLGKSWNDYKNAGNGYRYWLQPLSSIHIDSTNIESTITPSANGYYLKILTYVALLILIIACINFMNLTTARSSERAREIGVRKTIGSEQGQLIFQFLTESIIVSIIATGIALLLAQLMMPFFSQLTERQLSIQWSTEFILIIFGFAFLVGLASGLYPAFVLSSFSPSAVMKGAFRGNSRGASMRNGLIVLQFMISITLIAGTFVVSQQMHYVQSKNLGFNRDHVVYIEKAFSLDKKLPAFVDELRQFPGVVNAAVTSSMLGKEDNFFGEQFQPEGSTDVLTVKFMGADDYFMSLINFELREGKFFSKETNDSLNIILNETALKVLGLEGAIGKRLYTTDEDNGTLRKGTFTVIGIVKDFHFRSLRDKITPLVIFSNEFLDLNQFLVVKINPANKVETLAQIEVRWKEISPMVPFRYSFLSDQIQSEYSEEKRSGQLFSVFSTLTIIIACVGLFGLSAYTTGLRTKEIGVRKVLGASVASVALLLSKDFTKLILVAFVLAAPIGWWAMNNWLQNFAYRVALGASSFLLAGAIALSIALLTVSYNSIKAARVNPVNSLRSE